jgi:hypothetical protein
LEAPSSEVEHSSTTVLYRNREKDHGFSLNGLRAAKYAVRVASLLLSLLIIIVVAGPIVGAVSPQLMTQQEPVGIGIDLQAIQSQLQFFNSGSNMTGTHEIDVPAFNNWPLPGGASLLLALIVHGQTLYQTQPASVHLGAFQSGVLNISMAISPGLVNQLQGQNVSVGGSMSLSESQFWTITVSLAQQ